MKRLLTMLVAVAVNALMGGTLAMALGAAPLVGAVLMNCVSAVLCGQIPTGSLCAGVYAEVWTGELVKEMERLVAGSWLSGIPDASSLVDNDVIHLVDVGVDPDVLVNNTAYPITSQALTDSDITITLDKYQTKVTPVTDDELHAISYDKIKRVKDSHASAIASYKFGKSAHSFCAQSHTTKTPVLATSGDRVSDTGRLRLTMSDVVSMKSSMDKLGVPVIGRRLVLCNDHVNDLLLTDQAFREQYNINRSDGTIGRLYGFDIYENDTNPLYSTSGAKKAFGSTASAGEFQCSFAYYVGRVFKATGSTKMYWSSAENDPEYQRNKVNFRHYFVAMPKKSDSVVVIRSGYKATE